MSQALIAARHVSVTAEGTTILDKVSLAISRGEIVTLIGPNGSGKTTLLKALLGLVRVDGDIDRSPGLKIGYVPQQFERDPSLPITVEGFLRLFAPAAAIEPALRRTEILQARKKQMSALSGGELARVLLARAMAAKPDLLVLDEPTASVDVTGEAALYRLIAEIRDELGCGVLLVSHDLHVVMARANRVICLNRHICCEGTPAAVVRDPAFRAMFGVQTADEIALYAHHHRHQHTPCGDTIAVDEARE
ncbi:MAG: metal ABC transporter ATP-binding protein [Rhizomicrobium sp.]